MSDNESTNILKSSTSAPRFTDKGLLEAVNCYLREYFARHDIQNPPLRLYEVFLPKIECVIIKAALDFAGGKKSLTADILGMNRNTLRRKMEDLNIR